MKLGDYELNELIATGGMAEVYRAVKVGPSGFRAPVAVKILLKNLARDEQFRKMFIEEARIGALLKHRCLLNILDFGEVEGVSFIVSELFASISLEDLIDKTGRIPVEAALFILAEAAEGLEALHAAKHPETGKKLGLVHRDISPHNILIGDDGRTKIIDYGIVKKSDPTEKTRAGLVKGKLRYMAPEQALGGPVGPQADLYALGVVFLRCVSGLKPLGTGTTGEIMARAQVGVDVNEMAKKARLPKPVKLLANDMVKPGAQDRIKTASDIVRRARKILSDLAPEYDHNRFQKWVEDTDRKKPRRGKRKKKAPVQSDPQPTGIVRIESQGRGLHPKWIFFGLSVLFGVALLAHLLNMLIN